MIEDILRAIDEKAQSEIDKIQEEQEGAILALNKDYNKERERNYQRAKEGLLQKNKREIMEAQKMLELQTRFTIQRAKCQILEEVYQAALLKIDKLDDKVFWRLVGQMVKALPVGLAGQVKADKRTASILPSLLSGRQLTVKDDLSEDGFVVITPKLEIDLRFSQILNQNREKTDPEVLRILFT